ncbi:MAG: hypothetical protein ACI84K_000271 [Pseudohongiellaceae bacterium]|jgi:hypothetical protein
MKFISLLLALLIVGFLVKKQLNSSAPSSEINDIVNEVDLLVPEVPTAPKNIQKFEEDINEFMSDAADQRKREVEESLNY